MVNMVIYHSGTASMVIHACNHLVKSYARKGQDIKRDLISKGEKKMLTW